MEKKKKKTNKTKTQNKNKPVEVMDWGSKNKQNNNPTTEKPSKVITVIRCLIIGFVLFIALLKGGVIGVCLDNIFTFIFGSFYFWIGILFIVWMVLITWLDNFERKGFFIAGSIIISFAAILLPAVINAPTITYNDAFNKFVEAIKYITVSQTFGIDSGLLSDVLYITLCNLVGTVGTIAICVILIISGILLMVPFDKIDFSVLFEEVEDEPKQTAQRKEKYFIDDTRTQTSKATKKDVDVVNYEEKKTPKHLVKRNKEKEIEIVDVKPDKPEKIRKVGNYIFPSLSLLEESQASKSVVNQKAAEQKGERIIEILKTFDIEATLLNTYIGPSVTKFEIRPKQDVKISKIQNISDNIKMELAAKEIRIEAPIPGKSAVGIEIPNVEPQIVKLKSLIEDMPNKLSKKPLVFGLGKNLFGENVYCDLEKSLHFLIAGSTGSGKSVCINTLITSFLMKSDPKELKLVLIDPKKVEFTPYHDIPHLLWPVITDTKMATMMLQKIVIIMEQRYELMAEVGVRNIQGYNEYVEDYNAHLQKEELPKELLPRIVIIIDELADLMLIAGKDVEMSIQRITQLARASGIYLVVATQRPSTDVITGLIKSNIPSRIAFATASSIDSRTILDQTGAEKLLGNGDMLYFPQGENAPVRLQGCYVSDKEILEVSKWTKEQAKPEYEDTYFAIQNNLNGTIIGQGAGAEQDDLYDSVVEYVKETQKASTSLLQRKFGIGYNRAARLIDTLEDRGIIGPVNGSKPREVFVKNE